MDNADKSPVVHRFLLSLWGMATLVLLFCVIFLVYELMTFEAATPSIGESAALIALGGGGDTSLRTNQTVKLYFADPQLLGLVSERRPIVLTDDTATNCHTVLEELIQGPRETLAPVVSPSTRVRGIYMLDGGELVIDFSRDLEAGMVQSASSEWLMIQGIVTTLTQPDIRGQDGVIIRRVRFLFEGSPPQNTFPVHLSLSQPIAPDRSLFRRSEQASFSD